MALDSQIEGLLTAMRDAGARPFEDMTVPEARLASWDFVGLQGEAEPVARVMHRYVPGPTADIPVRIYYPNDAGESALPVIMYFHGSGFVIINIEICDATCRAIANRSGCAVVAVNYQKAPEHKFPAAVDDAWAATKWVVEHAEQLGVDASRIAVMGDSAGGNLAAVMALRARDEGGPSLACQVLVYPVTDGGIDTDSYRANAEGYLLQRETMRWFFNHYQSGAADADNPYYSPLRAKDHTRLPPALIITAEYDPLRDDGRLYAAKLKDAGVDATLWDCPGMTHAFFWMQGICDYTKKIHDDTGKWLRERLVKKP